MNQAPKAWYERLNAFLLQHGYEWGGVHNTLFMKNDKENFVIAQIYVDDVVFGSNKDRLVKEFCAADEVQISYDYGLWNVIFYGIGGDWEIRVSVEQTLYWSMIGSLLYLTASHPDICYVVCMCARYMSLENLWITRLWNWSMCPHRIIRHIFLHSPLDKPCMKHSCWTWNSVKSRLSHIWSE